MSTIAAAADDAISTSNSASRCRKTWRPAAIGSSSSSKTDRAISSAMQPPLSKSARATSSVAAGQPLCSKSTLTVMASYDAIVLGAGGVGSAAMYHLARRGARVLRVDTHRPPHTHGSTHGHTRVIRQAYFEHAD